jgi:hypothetical protein
MLAKQLSKSDRDTLIAALQKNELTTKKSETNRVFGKYNDQIFISDDFNSPIEDFNEYMKHP